MVKITIVEVQLYVQYLLFDIKNRPEGSMAHTHTYAKDRPSSDVTCCVCVFRFLGNNRGQQQTKWWHFIGQKAKLRNVAQLLLLLLLLLIC